MRSTLQCLKVEVCSAVVCAAAVLIGGAILLLPPGAHRFPGKTSHQRIGAMLAQRTGGAAADKAGPAVSAPAVQSYGNLPLSFEANQGQTDRQVRFLSRGSGYSLFLTGNEAVLSLRKGSRQSKVESRTRAGIGSAVLALRSAAFPGLLRSPAAADRGSADLFSQSAAFPPFFRPPAAEWRDESVPTAATNNEPRTTDALLRMKLVGANSNPKIVGMDQLPGKSNYFIGNDPQKWRTNVPNYAKVKYTNVYPGVDLVYYGNQGRLEYDFVVAPGADPRAITLELETGQSKIKNQKSKIDKDGDLVVGTDGGEVTFHKPVVYQPATYNEPRTTNGGGRDLVEGQYVLRGDDRIGFQLADYDRRRPVVIDPVLAYSTYLGGSDGDYGNAIAVDASGNAYVTGWTRSTDFPTTPGAFQITCRSCPFPTDAFVSKLNAAGSALVYSTYLGGSSSDQSNGIAVDVSGNAYVTGYTESSDFPTTPGAFQTTYGGGGDAFVTKLNAAGSALVYSTYLGGRYYDQGPGIALDAAGNAYVTGNAGDGFPTTAGAFQTTYGEGSDDAFVSMLNASGSALAYSTYLGGSNIDSASAIAVDASGNVYVGGTTYSTDFPTTPGAFQTTSGGAYDAFISKLNATGSALLYSTYLGGSVDDFGSGIAIDASGNAHVTGSTLSSDFPTTPGAFQTSPGGAFVTELNASGSALVYSTYLGGNGSGQAIAIDASGNAYVTGYSPSLPITPGALQTSGPIFICKPNAAGSALLYSTHLGGSGTDSGTGIAVDASGNVYVTGYTAFNESSDDFPTTPGTFQTTFGGNGDAFVTKISPADAPGLALGPGELIFGLQALGTTSAPQAVTLLAAGSQPLSITSIVASGDFAQTNTCGSAVPSGTTCTISVTFTPKAAGIRTGAVTITDNAAGSPHKLPLTGTGASGGVSLTPANVSFPLLRTVGTTSLAHIVKLTNVGGGELEIIGIT
jgi:hypothetical protein